MERRTPALPVPDHQPPWTATRHGRALAWALAFSVLAHTLVVTLLDGGWGRHMPEAIRRIELELVAGLPQPAVPAAEVTESERPASTEPVDPPTPGTDAPVERAPSIPARPLAQAQVDPPPAASAPSELKPPAMTPAEPERSESDGVESHRLAREAALRLDYLTWLERYKVYPVSARRRGVEGQVRVRFTVDREGRLLGGELIESSGSRHLDRAALDLLERAAPFPALPVDLAADRLEVELPIEYRLVGPHRT